MIWAVCLGILTWSLAEYCIHRWLGHRWTRNLFGREHTAHHSKGDYFAPTWKKLLTAALVVAAMIWPATAIAGTALGAAYVAGFVGFYLYYEALHRLAHVYQGVGPYGRWVRRHHFHHHFHAPKKNHGVTSPLWDWVFGTLDRPQQIRVPEKLKMRWLVDPATNDVWAHLAADYSLRRVRR